MKRFLAAAVSAAILFSAVGCGKDDGTTVTDSSIEADSVTEAESAVMTESEETEPKVVKAAAMSRNAARMWLLAGGELVAAVDEAADVSGLSKDIVWLGPETEPLVSDIAKSEADVIIADRTVAGYSGIRKELSETGFEIIEVGANSYEDYDASMQLLTESTENGKAYEEYVKAVAERNTGIIAGALEAARKVEVTVTELPSSDLSDQRVSEEALEQYYIGRTPSYLVIRVGEENCRAMSNDDYLSSMLIDFGMTNANKSGQQVVVWKIEESFDDTVSAAESVREEDSSSAETVKKTDDASTETVKKTDDASTETVKKDDNSSAEAGKQGDDSSVRTEASVSPDSSTSLLVTNLPTESAVDTFAGDTDTRESEDAGRRTFDNLLANNPDFIFVIYEGDEKTASANYNDLVKSCESWKESFAVQSGRVYELPQSSFRYPPNEMWDLAYEYLYQTIFNM